MKKTLRIILSLSLFIALGISSVYAEKQEWYDSSFDFTKVKKIAVIFRPSDRLNLVQYNESADIFMEKMKCDLIDELPAGQYEFASTGTIVDKIFKESGMDIASIAQTDQEKADKIFFEYIKKHYELFVVWSPLIYDTGSQYCEGYVYTMPSTNTSTIWLPNGQTATVTTNSQTAHNVPSGNYPAVYVAVRMDIVDPKTGNPVWMRIDDRAKINKTVFDNTTPKDVYNRIISSFIQDFEKTLKERTATKQKNAF